MVREADSVVVGMGLPMVPAEEGMVVAAAAAAASVGMAEDRDPEVLEVQLRQAVHMAVDRSTADLAAGTAHKRQEDQEDQEDREDRGMAALRTHEAVAGKEGKAAVVHHTDLALEGRSEAADTW